MTRARIVTFVIAASVAVGACGESPEDKARDDGKRVGEAARALYDADSPQDAEAAAADLKASINEVGEDARKQVQDQVASQGDALSKAAEAYRQGQTATSAGGVESARNDLRNAVQQVAAQADSFRSGNNSVANEFWRGFEDGFDND